MTRCTLRSALATGALAAAFVLLLAPRGMAAQDPRAFVQQVGTEGIQVLGPSVPQAQRVARFRQLFMSDFDVPGIGQFVLGRYWRTLPPEQQQEFLHLFQEYTVQAYSQRLGQYGGGQFRVLGARPNGDQIVVSSEVARPNGNPVRMDWYLVDRGGQYKITDVYVDGVSMKATQRDEFASIIQRNNGSTESLLAVLRQNLAQR
jgi:phospholipid transport system substrate-binding protein